MLKRCVFIRRHESKIGNLRYVGPHIIRGSVVELTFEASASLSKDQHEVPLHWAMMHVKKSGNATVAQLAPLPDDLNDISYARHVMEFQLEDIRMPTQMLSKTQLSLLLKKQRPVKSQRKCKVEASRRRSSRSSFSSFLMSEWRKPTLIRPSPPRSAAAGCAPR